MTQTQEAEPPGRSRPPHFLVGRDRRGNWVVQDPKGMCGGLFVSRDAAVRFVRSENGYRPQAIVVVSGTLELDMRWPVDTVPSREDATDPWFKRQVA